MGPVELLLIFLILSILAGPTLYPFLARRWKPLQSPFFHLIRKLRKQLHVLRQKWNRFLVRLLTALGKTTRILMLTIVIAALFLLGVITYIISGYIH